MNDNLKKKNDGVRCFEYGDLVCDFIQENYRILDNRIDAGYILTKDEAVEKIEEYLDALPGELSQEIIEQELELFEDKEIDYLNDCRMLRGLEILRKINRV